MNPAPGCSPRAAVLAVVTTLTTAVARAHPGHDDHDVTWDFTHLVDHPGATLLCFGVIGAGSWLVWRLVRRSVSSGNQSLRGSQPSRGK